MKENVGTTDRIIRSIAGPALFVTGYTKWGGNKGKTGGLVAMFLGFALIETAITRVCPLNELVGLDTREERLREKDAAIEIGVA